MKKIIFVSLILTFIITGCSPDPDVAENELDQNQDFVTSLEKVIAENNTSQELKQFTLNIDEYGVFSFEESNKNITKESFNKLKKKNLHTTEIKIDNNRGRSVTVCCSSRRGKGCTTCSGSNTGSCVSSALKKCSNSGNKKQMIYNPRDKAFLVLHP